MNNRYSGIRKRGEGIYEINFQVNKIRKQYRISAPSIRAARIMRAVAIAELGLRPSTPETVLLTNADFEQVWGMLKQDLLGDSLPKKTITRYRNSYNRMFRDFKPKYFPHIQNSSQLSFLFFNSYKNYYVTELKRPGGLRAELIIVKAMMRRLCKLKLCTKELIEELKEMRKPKPIKKNYPNLSRSDVAKLLAHIKTDRPDYYLPIYFISRIGRRITETTLIRKKDVIFDGLRPVAINIRPETTKMRENAPLTVIDDDLAKVLQQANSRSRGEWLFANKWGRRCTKDKIYEYLKRTSKAVLGVAITPHYFRHRFFTECVKSRVPMTDAMRIAGLKSVDIALGYYSHCTDEGMAKVLEATRL